MSDVPLQLTPTESVVIRSRSADALVVEGSGQTLEIPRGAAHQMWNDGSEPAHALWVTSAPGRTAQWFQTPSSAGKPGPRVLGAAGRLLGKGATLGPSAPLAQTGAE